MSKFRKSLPNEEILTSESESEDYFNASNYDDHDLSPSPPPAKRRKRQIKPPRKLSEYETEQSVDNTEEELCWCIIEWEGENTYDCINKDKISAVDGNLLFQPGEKVFATYKGKPFKATIAVIAATKNDAQTAYKENKQPKQTGKSLDKKTRSAESTSKPVRMGRQNRTEKGKASEKKRTQAQEDRELKANIQKAQVEQMKEVLRETKEVNFQQSQIDDIPDDQVPITPRHSSSPKVTVPIITAPKVTDDSDETCCQQCSLNKAALKRNSQALQILQQGMSALQNEIENLKRQASSQSSTSFTTTPMGTPITKKKPKNASTPSPPSPISCSFENSYESSNDSVGIEEEAQKEFTVKSPEQKMAVIPHHLRSKAAGANSLKKGARILAVGLFTVKERCSCTVSGSSNKSKQDTKRPQFEPHRMALIHEFLQKTYPKCYQYPEVNRIVGQVAIESRQGRHSSDDSVVLSLLN